jgi:L-alanine-DL-glutamate epimerase-like enolase superfamily enzyme
LVTALPPVEGGMIRPPDGPGLGTMLQPGIFKRRDCHITRSDLKD